MEEAKSLLVQHQQIATCVLLIVELLKKSNINIKKEHLQILSGIVGAFLNVLSFFLFRYLNSETNIDWPIVIAMGASAGSTASGQFDFLKNLFLDDLKKKEL